MIYLDNAATTPVSGSVLDAMKPYFSEKYGNPSSIYKVGQEARSALEHAREEAAKLLGASPKEIIFTSGATESNNLALKGVAFYWSQVLDVKPHIIVSSIEHHSVLDVAEYLEKNFGFEITKLPVSEEGIVDPKELEKSIRENTALVSIMYGNNEIGSIQPIGELSQIVRKANEGRENKITFHTDAVQAFQYLDTNVNDLDVGMLSLTGHKFYGPKGVGLLYVRDGVKFLPQTQGGSQERKRRAGTENVPYIVGMVEAMKNANKSGKEISVLRDYLVESITKEIPDVVLTGPKDNTKRLPHIAGFIFKKIEGESILINLDLLGIAASSGSACTSGSLASSHVLTAMGYDDLLAHGSIRFSLGKMNSRDDVDELMKHLPQIVEKLRGMSPIK
ncbi:MAG: cysteine desulfurase family protein [bacterium]|nr:cysteine desulfurase family protein [bacterium]